jgi:hypothetical protein
LVSPSGLARKRVVARRGRLGGKAGAIVHERETVKLRSDVGRAV